MSREVVTRFKEPKPAKVKAKKLTERCDVGVDGCWGRAQHRHHIRRRSQGGGDDPENLLACCWKCHGWLHDNVAAAKVAGWLA